jgi:glutaredoxin
MKVTIYGKTRCSYCDAAKALCEQKGFDYEYLLLDADYTFETFQESFPGARTFPQIVIGEEQKTIGGFREFQDFLDPSNL